MATCTVTLTTNAAAISGAVTYEPLPNQVVNGVAIDLAPVVATASGTAYTATLTQGARYAVRSRRFSFQAPIFQVPASASADLDDLLEQVLT